MLSTIVWTGGHHVFPRRRKRTPNPSPPIPCRRTAPTHPTHPTHPIYYGLGLNLGSDEVAVGEWWVPGGHVGDGPSPSPLPALGAIHSASDNTSPHTIHVHSAPLHSTQQRSGRENGRKTGGQKGRKEEWQKGRMAGRQIGRNTEWLKIRKAER